MAYRDRIGRGLSLTTDEFYALLEDVHAALFVTDPSGGVTCMDDTAARLPGLQDRVESEGGTINVRDDIPDTFDVRTLDGRPVGDADRPLVRALRGETFRDAEVRSTEELLREAEVAL